MLDKRAYTEAFYIINEMSDELKRKIPNEIIKNIESRMDTDYEFFLDEDIEDAELLEDTEKILSVLYTDYLASDEEKSIIKNKEKILEEKEYSNFADTKIKEIFPKKQITKEENKELVEFSKNKWYTNILKFFKNFLGKLKK